jgi:hypothetical protein
MRRLKAQVSRPQRDALRALMSAMESKEEGPVPETNGPQATVDRAAETSQRLLDAATKVGNACLDACQETVSCIEDFRDKVAETTPLDWRHLAAQPGLPGSSPLGEQWRSALGQPLTPGELAEPARRFCLAYVDAYEQTALRTIDVQERAAAVTNVDWIRSLASTRASIARDVTRACTSLARQFLTSA